ncbi:DUF4105 domain-containing protein [Mesorhizobium sp. BR1-1-16]|uniref:Lnb N-terminal periplasmic domain-containing protein n=1 Tax=Mesorhizobium sp. BR1-1-16 TaxID=2876653 RepID=UPI001CCE7AE5|nr:DUF4105 domain-containing protein [Mesorhizobium sp. BR1-1-16]MBZ9937068.1 DUF4105 domain-containing protein [Mesorhizobium sp. BR1-1-16]
MIVLRGLGRLLFALVILLTGGWVALAFWFQLPFGQQAVVIAIVIWAIFVVAIVLNEIVKPTWRSRIVYGLAFLAVLGWWSTIRPSNDRDWADAVEHGVTGTVAGNIATLQNVRDFDWRSEMEFTPRWGTRRYDLSTLSSVDLILAYWDGPALAHAIVSFGFDNGDHIAFSAEIRPEAQETFSALGGFFREFELVLIGADERDVVKLRTNVRGEDVYLYPLTMPKPAMRQLFLSYIELGNDLAATPRFYNSLTANCTTVVFRLVRALDPGLPLDWRILISGYLPGYLFDRQSHPAGMTLDEFRSAAAISERARAAGAALDFSTRIRLPTPPAPTPGDGGSPAP